MTTSTVFNVTTPINIPNTLENKIIELETRLDEEKILREELEQRIRILENKVPNGSAKGHPGYDGLPTSWEERVAEIEARMGELKLKLDFEETPGERLERVGMSQDYSKDLYYELERGKLPEQFHLKSAIHRALGELISKPSHKKNPIEQRLDDLFLEYLPPKFMNSAMVKKNLDCEVAPVPEEYGKGMIQGMPDQWDLREFSPDVKDRAWSKGNLVNDSDAKINPDGIPHKR
jgi:hypothetical protein